MDRIRLASLLNQGRQCNVPCCPRATKRNRRLWFEQNIARHEKDEEDAATHISHVTHRPEVLVVLVVLAVLLEAVTAVATSFAAVGEGAARYGGISSSGCDHALRTLSPWWETTRRSVHTRRPGNIVCPLSLAQPGRVD